MHWNLEWNQQTLNLERTFFRDFILQWQVQEPHERNWTRKFTRSEVAGFTPPSSDGTMDRTGRTIEMTRVATILTDGAGMITIPVEHVEPLKTEPRSTSPQPADGENREPDPETHDSPMDVDQMMKKRKFRLQVRGSRLKASTSKRELWGGWQSFVQDRSQATLYREYKESVTDSSERERIIPLIRECVRYQDWLEPRSDSARLKGGVRTICGCS